MGSNLPALGGQQAPPPKIIDRQMAEILVADVVRDLDGADRTSLNELGFKIEGVEQDASPSKREERTSKDPVLQEWLSNTQAVLV